MQVPTPSPPPSRAEYQDYQEYWDQLYRSSPYPYPTTYPYPPAGPTLLPPSVFLPRLRLETSTPPPPPTTTTTTTSTTTEEARSIYLYPGVGDHDDSYDATEDHSDATAEHEDASDATEDVTVDEVGNSSEILRNLSLASTNSTAAGHLASRLFQGYTFTMH